MTSSVWSVAEWCVFMQPIRTNNDVEGWCRRLNVRARRGRLPFYMLLQLLHSESQMVELQAHLVSENKLRRYQRKKYAKLQGKLFSLWEQYTNGDSSTGDRVAYQCLSNAGTATGLVVIQSAQVVKERGH